MQKADKGITNDYYKRPNIYGSLENDIAKMNAVFEIFNNKFFDNQLDTPIIMINPDLKVLYRVDRPDGWKKVKDGKEEDELFKIVLAEKVFEFEEIEVYFILLKAMILQYDLEQESIYKVAGEKWKRLVNNNNHYFSKKYYIFCKSIGLEVIENEEKMEVVAGAKFNEVYENYIKNVFELTYKYVQKTGAKKKNTQSMRAYKCPSCGLIIRVTKAGDIDIRCYNTNSEGNSCDGVRFKEVK